MEVETKKQKKKGRTVGNGEGSLCFSASLNKWEFYYYLPGDSDRKVMRQKKNEKVKDFKARVTELKNQINNGTYVVNSKESVVSILKEHIERKYKNKKIKARAYVRDLETLKAIEKTCFNFCYMPIKKVTIKHIEDAKLHISQSYADSVISKIWGMLKKAFSIAASPSRKYIQYNIMLDEELERPISEKKKEKVKAFTSEEFKKLNSILDNEEKNHKYRNIVKMQCISGMRIGEVLARSKNDYDDVGTTFDIHNTLTQDENYKVILGEHTKTYDEKTQTDLGQRYLPLEHRIFNGLSSIIKFEINKKITNIHNLLFWDYEKNTFITPNEINSWLDRINKKYNICKGPLASHRIRHTVITFWYYIENLPLSVIQYFAGHVEGSSITNDVYIDTNLENIRKALKNVN